MKPLQHLEVISRWRIKEPNKQEFEKFKREFSKSRFQNEAPKKALYWIGELESYTHDLEHRLYHLQKLDKKEYIEFMRLLQQDRQEVNKKVKKLKKENQRLIEKLASSQKI